MTEAFIAQVGAAASPAGVTTRTANRPTTRESPSRAHAPSCLNRGGQSPYHSALRPASRRRLCDSRRFPFDPMPNTAPELPMLNTLPLLPTLRIEVLLPTLSSDAKLPTLRMEAALATLSTLAQLKMDQRLLAL